MRPPCCRLLCILIAGLLTMCQARGGDVHFRRDRALEAWALLAKKVKSLRYTVVTETSEASKGKPLRTAGKTVEKYAWSDAGFVSEVENTRYDEKPDVKRRPVFLKIINRQYTATLDAVAGKGDWRLREVKVLNDANEEIQYSSIIAFPWLIGNRVPLRLWLADDSFVVKRAEQIQDGSADLVRVHFVYDREKRGSTLVKGKIDIPDNIQDGYVDLEPANCYRVMSYEYRLKTPGLTYTARGNLEYGLLDGFPLLKKQTVEYPEFLSDKVGPMSGREIATCTVEYNADVPDDEFRLSYYGLPEPNGVIWPSQTRWYLWFIAAGIVCLAGAAYFWHRAQRRKIPAVGISVQGPGSGE